MRHADIIEALDGTLGLDLDNVREIRFDPEAVHITKLIGVEGYPRFAAFNPDLRSVAECTITIPTED